MACKTKNLHIKHWQEALPDVLHFMRSLPCTSTNGTPHKRLFCLPRRSTSGTSVPTWLATPGPVSSSVMSVVACKIELLVDEVGAYPTYAHILAPDGWTTTVSTKHFLAPCSEQSDHKLPPEVDSEPRSSPEIELNANTQCLFLFL